MSVRKIINLTYPALDREGIDYITEKTIECITIITNYVPNFPRALEVQPQDAAACAAIFVPAMDKQCTTLDEFPGKKEKIEKSVQLFQENIEDYVKKLHVNWIDIVPDGEGKIKSKIDLAFINRQDPDYVKKSQQIVRKRIDQNLDKYLPFSDTTYRDITKYISRGEETNYTDFTINTKWYSMYGLNWLFQLQFFHHFHHNQIILLTGEPGVGKTTEIPRLLLYALLTVDSYKNKKVVCTQPKKTLASSNSRFVSQQMGYDIDVFQSMNPSEREHVVQFQHSDSKYKKNVKTSLMFCTDQILLNDIIENPKQAKQGVIFVDESHEHNTNMDMILTLVKKVMVNKTNNNH